MKKPESERNKIKETTKTTTARVIKEIAKSEGMLAAIGDGIAVVDRTLKVLYENQVHKDMMGDHVGEYCYKAYAKKEVMCGGCPVTLTFKDGKVHSVQRELHTDTETRYLEITASPLKDSTGEIIAGIEVVRDITERKRSQEALKLEAQLLDAATDSIFLLDFEGNLIYINEAAYKSRGYTKDELMAMNLKDFDIPEHAKFIGLRMQELMEKGEATFESAHFRKDGSILPLEVHARIIEVGDKKLALSVTRDITERKIAEKSLRLNESRLEALLTLNHIPDASFKEVSDFALEEAIRLTESKLGYLAFMNDDETVLTMYSWSKSALEECRIADKPIIYPVETTGLWGEAVRQRKPIITNDYTAPNPWKKGYPKDHVELTRHMNVPIFDGDHMVIVAGVGNKLSDYDVADVRQLTLLMEGMWKIIQRKLTKETLRKERDKAQRYLDVASVILLAIDAEQKVTLINKKGSDILDYSEQEIIGKNWFDNFLTEQDRHRLKTVFVKLIAGEVEPVEYFENSVLTKSGAEKIIAWHNTVLKDESGNIVGTLSSGDDITERKDTEEALKESEERFKDLFENANDLIQIVDAEGKYLYVNQKWLEILGFTEEETKRLHFSDIVKKEQIPHCMENFRRIAKGETIEQMETIYVSKDGRELYIEGNMSPSFKDGKFVSCRGIFRDITKRKKAEKALLASEAALHDAYFTEATINMILSESLKNIPLEEFLQKALNMILSIPWIAFESIGSISLVDDDADILIMKAQSNIPGSLEKLCARVPFGECLCGKAAQSQKIEFADHVDERHDICYEGIQPHGHYSLPILFSGRTLGVLNIYLKEGHIRDEKEEEFLRTVADTLAGIIMRKKAENRIEYLAYYDGLTGLPTRNLFIDRLKQGIARAEPASKIVAVLITNIDRFKSINDTYGTEVGDRVLTEVAERLSTAVRKGDTVARLGNDEFGIALLDVANLDDVITVMEKIMKYISYPLKIDSNEISLTFSTGISIYPHDNINPLDLLKSAGLALGIAKKEGRKTYQFYTEDLNVKASEFMLMEKNLYNAIKNEEFVLHYQPYWEINTQKMVGMEALIRWQSKDMGLVSPGEFIPVLEDTGMIIEVGEWVLRTAIRQVKEWHNNGYPVVPISVNMSIIQFRQKDLTKMVKRIIGDCGFYPSLLTLEITESAFMHNIEFTKSALTTMKDIGCSVSIDDFGTGYSSLAYLKRFPVDNLKIDISFIRDIVKDPDSASIVMAIINMAHTLNLKTIAEGIETEEQWNFLRLLRCDMGQGFYLSKPLPAEEIEKLLID